MGLFQYSILFVAKRASLSKFETKKNMYGVSKAH